MQIRTGKSGLSMKKLAVVYLAMVIREATSAAQTDS